MIVKLSTGCGWRFIDRVDDVEAEDMRKDWKEPVPYPCQHYFCDEKITWVKKLKILRQENPGYTLGDNLLFIKTDQSAYLLNDEGKTIEKCLAGGQWVVETGHPCMWNWSLVHRIKSEPTYRPYNAEELECLVGTVVKDEQRTYLITQHYFDRVLLNEQWVYAENLLKMFTKKDGSPCGVKVEC